MSWRYMESVGIAPPFLASALDRGVSFTIRPLSLGEKSPRYLLDRRLNRPQVLSGSCWIHKKYLATAGNRIPVAQLMANHWNWWRRIESKAFWFQTAAQQPGKSTRTRLSALQVSGEENRYISEAVHWINSSDSQTQRRCSKRPRSIAVIITFLSDSLPFVTKL
jgi:hypothetical protein